MKSDRILQGIIIFLISVIGLSDLKTLFSMGLGVGTAIIIIGMLEKEDKNK